MKKTTKIKIVAVSIANAVFMLILSLFLLSQPVIKSDEKELIKNTTWLKEKVLGKDKPPKDDFLFVNIAFNKELIDKLDVDGLPIGNQAITDRNKLAKLFSILNKKPDNQKFILCDVLFIDDSPNDTLLAAEIQKFPNIVIPYVQNITPKFAVNQGLVEYTAVGDFFVKYKLQLDDSLKSLPLVMYEKLHQTTMQEGNWFYSLDNQTVFNNFILNLRITKGDLLDTNKIYPVISLSELLQLSDNDVLAQTKNRIVVIGDFSDIKNDYHKTVVGPMPGALILLNAYLALTKRDNKVPFLLSPVLLLGFFLVSLLVFYPVNVFEKFSSLITSKIPNAKLADYIVGFLSYATLLSIISIGCFLLFNMHLNVLYLTTYIYGLEKVIEFVRKRFMPTKA